MLTSSGGGGCSMLTVADRERGGKICQNLADVICERSLRVTPVKISICGTAIQIINSRMGKFIFGLRLCRSCSAGYTRLNYFG